MQEQENPTSRGICVYGKDLVLNLARLPQWPKHPSAVRPAAVAAALARSVDFSAIPAAAAPFPD